MQDDPPFMSRHVSLLHACQRFGFNPAECQQKASESNRDQWRSELKLRLGTAVTSWIGRHRQREHDRVAAAETEEPESPSVEPNAQRALPSAEQQTQRQPGERVFNSAGEEQEEPREMTFRGSVERTDNRESTFTEFAAAVIPIHQYIDSFNNRGSVERTDNSELVNAVQAHDTMTPEFREGVVVSNCDRVDDNVTGLPGSVDIDDTLFLDTRTAGKRMNTKYLWRAAKRATLQTVSPIESASSNSRSSSNSSCKGSSRSCSSCSRCSR